MKLLLVFNAKAGAGRAERLLPRLRAELEKFAVLDVLQTGCAGEAVRLVAEADVSAYDGLIASIESGKNKDPKSL